MHVHLTKVFFFLLKMVDWTFSEALAAINSPPLIPTSVLETPDGLCLGDVCFAKICTTIWMRAVSLMTLEKLVVNGAFNPEHIIDGDHSHSTAILLALSPSAQLKHVESVGIGLVVCQHGAPLALISSMAKLISYIHEMMKLETRSATPKIRMYCMIIGNYPGHMAYAAILCGLSIGICQEGHFYDDIEEYRQPPSHAHGHGYDHMPAACVGLPRV